MITTEINFCPIADIMVTRVYRNGRRVGSFTSVSDGFGCTSVDFADVSGKHLESHRFSGPCSADIGRKIDTLYGAAR